MWSPRCDNGVSFADSSNAALLPEETRLRGGVHGLVGGVDGRADVDADGKGKRISLSGLGDRIRALPFAVDFRSVGDSGIGKAG